MEDPLAFQTAYFDRHPGAWSVLELFDALPHVSFYAKDKESRYVRVNRLSLETHGMTDEREMLGRSDRDFHPPVMAEAYIAEDRRVMAGRKPIPGQVWLVFHANRLPQWYVSTKVPLFDPGGTVVGISGAMYLIEQPAEHERHFRELSPVIQHIDRHHAGNISMEEMAALSGLSATHFNRRFQQLLKMTPSAYLRSVRVQGARRLLGATDRPLAEIAQQCGFTDQSHFTRCFREATGLTPRGYRQRFRK
ncbi:AraC family transcriptional regulator [Luteolibacter arcticus]|uniref:AraC family transcriptional regulator n=1 Tax=Luteolibacter arcticus TaxID=1581411 RepID=A0ABT3GNJ3_9BACT|nr:AraC family transcriptional regulator [Luteolibacter arcticus]MCW1925088.1 AraC family transcriptional regulator [Luteolibacter arcticus]